VNPHLRAFENTHFANVLGYHAKYYNAMAWMQMAEAQVELTNKNSRDCGKCVGMLKGATKKFEECLPFVAILGG